MHSEVKDESFRDTIATIAEDGNRAWIYPKKPIGELYNKRTVVSIILLTLLFSGPFMKWNGHAMFLFNVLERKFILFGIPFWPQDFFLFVLAMLTFLVFIILFTVVFGRVWCGWACPQTIFMEMVFRKIEYWIEGDQAQQKQLHNAPWTANKIQKKLTKHGIFFFIAFLIANTFLSYIIGVDQMKLLVTEGSDLHMAGFIALLVFTAVFYGVYARFREQVCIVVCPYGRLQGVLLDRDSVVIAYDYSRGEPRGKIHKNENRSIGDCIDCHQCVSVCPTGIDIRNGTQLECVNCSACIDACNSIMEKVNFPKGLIRYTSENSIADKKKFSVSTRIIAYAVVLFLLLTSLIVLLSLRTDVDSTIMRTPGLLYQMPDSNHVSNLYNIELVNKTFHDLNIKVVLNKPEGEIKFIGNEITSLKKDGVSGGVFFVILPQSELTGIKTPVFINIISGNEVVGKIKTNFLGPAQN